MKQEKIDSRYCSNGNISRCSKTQDHNQLSGPRTRSVVYETKGSSKFCFSFVVAMICTLKYVSG